ncbi:MAG TPA: class II glutamine amidotransferase [Myxococcota bacterium]|nr:class II glutamine amidotransferase [Myxococcota bacterium]
MCRIFGFRSVLDSRVHRSLLSAENALAVQSERHPDGWGVAYYVAGSPHVIRSAGAAVTDQLFQRVSGIVTSQTVLAHVRKATQGELSPLNCHPFQYGRWVLAHNGDVPAFPEVRDPLLERVAPRFRRFLLGDTDSEVIFHLFLTHLAARADLTRRGTPIDQVVEALRATVADVRGVLSERGHDPDSALLTLVVSDGELLVGHQGGKELHFSTWKERCSEREGCPFLSRECEAPTESGYVNHLIVSSEPLLGENRWERLAPGELVGVDAFMRLARYRP